MANSFEEIAATAMKLPARERVRLAQQLAASLEGEVEGGEKSEGLFFIFGAGANGYANVD